MTILIFAISLLVMLSLQSLLSLPQYTDVRNIRFAFAMVITASITVICIGLTYRFIHRGSIKDIGLHWNKKSSLLTLVSFLIIVFGFTFYSIYTISKGYASIKDEIEYLPIIILIVLYIGVSVNEEFLFRGYLHRFYRERNIVVAYFISIPMFLLPHFLNRDFELSYIFALLSASLLITLLYDLTKSIWPSIIIHTVLNVSLSLLSTGDNSGSILSLESNLDIFSYTDILRFGEIIINVIAIIAVSLICTCMYIINKKNFNRDFN
ncbi:MAG: CPBP family intramembrane metalloprotease [Firmicutes bacterium]|nr:CPBP family intramembrane metalloprotease [Bacillota bacterium]